VTARHILVIRTPNTGRSSCSRRYRRR
jgi:hypothetical protein